jgi:hypothetical protein
MQDKPRRSGRRKAPTRRDTGSRRTREPRAIEPLPSFDPFTPGSEHPDWVMKEFPSYVEHSHEALARSTRELEHRGRTITITTTYEVRLDERLLTLHMMVDEEGRLWSHLCPYLTFATATELVCHLLERLPHLFEPAPDSPGRRERGEPMDHGAHAPHPARARGGAR